MCLLSENGGCDHSECVVVWAIREVNDHIFKRNQVNYQRKEKPLLHEMVD